MDYLLICTVSLFAAGLTLFSGFGLGTLLAPVFAIFFPLELALALTAIVHLLNNIFKLGLVGKFAVKDMVIKFGIPAMIASFAGAFLLNSLGELPVVHTYLLLGKNVNLTLLNLVIGALIAFFALFELIPRLSKLTLDKKYLVMGGLLSGFLGGLSGNQGALRSVFLLRAGLSKESFIGTGVVIACMVDVARLIIYSEKIAKEWNHLDFLLLFSAVCCAFVGSYIGSKFITKMTFSGLQLFVGILLIVLAVAIGGGLVG